MFATSLQTLASMALIMLTGFILTRSKVVDRNFSGQLSQVMYYVVIPALILSTCTMPYSPERLREGIGMLGLGTATIAVLFAVGIAAYLITGKTVHSRLVRFGNMYRNFNMMGYPLIGALYGEYGLFLFSLMVLPIRILCYIAADALMKPQDKLRSPASFFRAFGSPLVLYAIASLILYVLQPPLPELFTSAIDTISQSSTALGMLLCGMMLGEANIAKSLRDVNMYKFLLWTLIISPAVMLAMTKLFGIKGVSAQLMAIYCVLPTAANFETFALRYECAPEEAAVDIAMAMLASVILVPLWMFPISML